LCRLGDEEATEDFIAVGKDVNMQDAEGRTPLHFAAAHNNTKIMQALLDAGADPAKGDSKSNAPLHYATGYGRVDAVGILLDAGADIKGQNATGKTPLDVAKLNPSNPLFEYNAVVKRLTP
jgi:ankyrin repeat protein